MVPPQHECGVDRYGPQCLLNGNALARRHDGNAIRRDTVHCDPGGRERMHGRNDEVVVRMQRKRRAGPDERAQPGGCLRPIRAETMIGVNL